MTLLVFGRTGQVAMELARLVPDAVFLSREQADLGDPDACADAIRAHGPHAVINAAAYTVVDRAEQEEPLATRINGAAPGAMARTCAGLGIPFVHISTDYVFDGSGSAPWRPSDPTAPQNAYGRSKCAGEEAVRAAAGTHAILRTSWVFSTHGANFVKTMLRLSETRDALGIVEDQIGGPTLAADIAGACLAIADQLLSDPGKSGTYHFSGAPDISWKGFAEAIFAETDRRVTIAGIATADYPTPAARPLNSRLDCQSTRDVFGIGRPDWRAGLRACLGQLNSH
ncbi:dTDP-4-dehydrorhamnose reductase [Roseovarius azorensis]|uniref:dTDP-4-dehydrorhamnose reductase n=1 Tax=Roseovarius azorensis TaxID=1287727 RepID=A0A1H7PYX3_9RHOB|nr:dTDP-4-dehydrorhamnose reductase [Roseovarius azorensis]SEL40678.1 dTDP-4-dehydrorhamnose reductase [Roseovarius azorensis]